LASVASIEIALSTQFLTNQSSYLTSSWQLCPPNDINSLMSQRLCC